MWLLFWNVASCIRLCLPHFMWSGLHIYVVVTPHVPPHTYILPSFSLYILHSCVHRWWCVVSLYLLFNAGRTQCPSHMCCGWPSCCGSVHCSQDGGPHVCLWWCWVHSIALGSPRGSVVYGGVLHQILRTWCESKGQGWPTLFAACLMHFLWPLWPHLLHGHRRQKCVLETTLAHIHVNLNCNLVYHVNLYIFCVICFMLESAFVHLCIVRFLCIVTRLPFLEPVYCVYMLHAVLECCLHMYTMQLIWYTTSRYVCPIRFHCVSLPSCAVGQHSTFESSAERSCRGSSPSAGEWQWCPGTE